MTMINQTTQSKDWRHKSSYLSDPLQPYMNKLKEWRQAELDVLRHMQWRWEFLRRHPDYIKGWKKAAKSHELSYAEFGLAIKAPDPAKSLDFVTYFGKLADNKSYDPLELKVTIRIDQPLALQINQIKAQYASACKRIGETFKGAMNLKIGRSRLTKKDMIRSLQVLDALQAGASHADIGRLLGGTAGKSRPTEYGKNYVSQAFKIQQGLTKLPMQELPK